MLALTLFSVITAHASRIEDSTVVVEAKRSLGVTTVSYSPKVGPLVLPPVLVQSIPENCTSLEVVGGAIVLRGTGEGLTWQKTYTMGPEVGQVSVQSSFDFAKAAPRASTLADMFISDSAIGINRRLQPGQTATLTSDAVLVAADSGTPLKYVVYDHKARLGFLSWEVSRKGRKYEKVLRAVPQHVVVSYAVMVGPDAVPRAQQWSWSNFGRKALISPFPQALPFIFSTSFVYSFGESEEEEMASEDEKDKEDGPWWTGELDDTEVGAPREPGVVRFTEFANSMRSAWGMKWWADKIGHREWEEHAEQLFNLMLTAPRGEFGGMATEFTLKSKTWTPYQDWDSSAVNAYWTLRWLEKWPEGETAEKAGEFLNEVIEGCSELQGRAEGLPSERNARGTTGTSLIDPRLTLNQLRFLDRCSHSSVLDEPDKRKAQETLDRYRAWKSKLDTVSRASIDRQNRTRATSTIEEEIESQSVGRWRLVHDLTFGPDDLDENNLCLCEKGRVALCRMRVGAITDRKDLFERGVVLLREQLQYISDPSLTAVGIHGPHLTFGRAATSLDSEGDYGEWLGFEHGEGQVLASFAEALDEFGGFYIDDSGWRVGIDGCVEGPDKLPESILQLNPRAYAGDHKVDVVSSSMRETVSASNPPRINRLEVRWENGGSIVVAVPVGGSNSTPDNRGQFISQDGSWRSTASLGATGFEAHVPDFVLRTKSIEFSGVYGGGPVDSGFVRLHTSPDRVWERTGDLVTCFAPSLEGIGTGDDGTGKAKHQMKGRVMSQPFWATSGALTFTVRSNGPGCEVVLRNLLTGDALEDLQTSKGARRVRWNMSKHNGQKLRIELIDRSTSSSLSLTGLQLTR